MAASDAAPLRDPSAGGGGLQAQLKLIQGWGAEEDLTFKERCVRDITDRGRTEGAARLQRALQSALESLPPLPPPARPKVPQAADPLAEAELRREVRTLLRPLEQLRQVGGHSVARNTAVMDVLLQLRRLDMTAACLKATKVAAELNNPCWRGNEVSAEVRELAASLVKKWRATFRAEVGSPGTAEVLSASSLARKSRVLSMDLEAKAHGQCARANQYMELVDELCALLLREQEIARRLFTGAVPTAEVVGKVAEILRQRKECGKRR